MAAGRGMLPNAFAALGDMQSPVTDPHIGHISLYMGLKDPRDPQALSFL